MISRTLRLARSFRSLNITQVRMPFTSSLELIDKTKAKLQKIVEKELKYEKTNYAADETAKDFIDSKGFQVSETDGDNSIELTRQIGDVHVQVCFQSRAPTQEEEQPEEKQENQQNQEQEQEQEEQESSDYADFTVYLTKSGGKTLCYECSSVSSEIQVSMVSIVDDVNAHKKIPRYQRGIDDFQGPDFNSLDERLQSGLIDYLKGYGVNEELAAFVEHYSLDKEQRLYMQWLEQLTTYLKN